MRIDAPPARLCNACNPLRVLPRRRRVEGVCMPTLFQFALIGYYTLAVLTIGHILRRRREPTAMLAWILTILLLPVAGIILYGLLGENRVRRRASRRRKRLSVETARISNWAESSLRGDAPGGAAALPPDLAPVEDIGRRLSHFPATGCNDVRIYEEANETYAAIEESIRSAVHHVHLEYYIWQPDETGVHFRDLLVEKARQGVECRLLLDAVGCWNLGSRFLKPLIDAGVSVEFFLPIYKLRKRWSPHLRNHRKLIVVDGCEGFLGSQNIGDEYRGRLKRLSPWYDTHLRIRGPAALFLQQIFADDWLFATRESLDLGAYFAAPTACGDTIVQILPTGPDSEANVLGSVLFSAVSCAKSSIRIATPYFVPDAGLLMALKFAAYRGVRVQLVIPTRTDAPLVLWAGRSYYAELISSGVEIFEYPHGVLHSKIATIDDRWCMVSSANMDIRSFRLNFELTAILYDEDATRRIGAFIERRLERAAEVTAREAWNRPLHQQLLEGAARLFSPLL